MGIGIIITLNILIVTVAGVYVYSKGLDRELIRFREFAKAVMAKDLQEYVETIPEENDEKIEEGDTDELVDLGSIEEEILIKALHNEYEDKQN